MCVEEGEGDAGGVVAFFPEGCRREGDAALAGGFEEEVVEGLVGWEVEGDLGCVEACEAGFEGGD